MASMPKSASYRVRFGLQTDVEAIKFLSADRYFREEVEAMAAADEFQKMLDKHCLEGYALVERSETETLRGFTSRGYY